MSRSEAVQPSPPQAREGYRHVAITLHCAIHEAHDRTQTAKIVGSLAQAENALNSCGLSGQAIIPADAFSAIPVQMTDYPGHVVVAVQVTPQDQMPTMLRADAFSAGNRTTTTHVNEAGNA